MRPFVFINVAVTADGKMDSFERRGSAISSLTDKERVLRLRAEADAVMVGGQTLINEDPKLTVKSSQLRQERAARGQPENPIKVGVTSQALPQLGGDFMTAGPARRVIFTTSRAAPEQVGLLSNQGVEIHILGEKRVNLEKALERLHALGVTRLMVEGGGTLNFELLRLGFVDELYVYTGGMIIGGENAPTLVDGQGFRESFPRLRLDSVEPLDEGVLLKWSLTL